MDVGSCQILFCFHLHGYMIFYVLLLMWYMMLLNLHILNHTFISGMKPTWPLCIIFWCAIGYDLLKFFLRIFASVLINDICLWFSFLVVYLSAVGISVMLPPKKRLGKVLISLIFWKSLRISGSNSLNVW